MPTSSLPNEIGVPLRVTATGTSSIGNANRKAALLGILVGSMTAPTVRIHQGQAVAASSTIIGNITCAANAFTRIPVYTSGGATFVVTGVDSTVDLTIYWNPLG